MNSRLVLVVDSRPHSRDGLVRALWRAGFDVAAAGSTAEALAAAEELCPEIVVVDSFLEDRPGFELVRALHRLPGNGEIRVVLHAPEWNRQCWKDQGWRALEVDRCIGSSWSPETVAAAVRELWQAIESCGNAEENRLQPFGAACAPFECEETVR